MPWPVDFNMPWPVDFNRRFNKSFRFKNPVQSNLMTTAKKHKADSAEPEGKPTSNMCGRGQNPVPPGCTQLVAAVAGYLLVNLDFFVVLAHFPKH